MTRITVTVGGIEQVITVLERYSDLPKLLDPAFRKWVDETNRGQLHGRDKYPPERPGQRYVRTGALGAGFRYEPVAPSHYRFTNDVVYTRWVVGDSDGGGQAWFHRGRWWTAKERVEAQEPGLIDALEKAATDAAK